MTKGMKGILEKDLKKYISLFQYSDDEHSKEIYMTIVNFFEELLNK